MIFRCDSLLSLLFPPLICPSLFSYPLIPLCVMFLFPHFSYSNLKEKGKKISNKIILFSFFALLFGVSLTSKKKLFCFDFKLIECYNNRTKKYHTIRPLFRLHISFYFALFALSFISYPFYLVCVIHQVVAGNCPGQIYHYSIDLLFNSFLHSCIWTE